MTKLRNYHFGSIIDGKELDKGERTEIAIHNPYNAEVLGKILYATLQDAENAVTSAHRVYTKTMKKMPINRRAEILRKTADLLESEKEQFAHLLTLEGGKPIKASRLDVAHAAQVLRFVSQAIKSIYEERVTLNQVTGESHLGMVKRVSLGVIAISLPVNYPLTLLLYKMAPAIAAGNTIVLNPTETTVYSTGLLYRLFEKAGMPKGVINIIAGPNQSLVGNLMNHPKVKIVICTKSSVESWKEKDIIKKKKILLDFKTKNPTIIFDEADLDFAINTIVNAGLLHTDRSIMCAQHVFVQKGIYEKFLEELIKKVQTLKIGNPLDDAIDIGPMITLTAAEKAETWIRNMIEKGAIVLVGGSRHHTMMEPTIISGVTADSTVARGITFAPIISVMPFHTKQDVMSYMNVPESVLHAGIFTKNSKGTTRKEEINLAIEEMTTIKLIGNNHL
ncbi:succinic semialdehyde dehydrogenase [Planococcus halocryophilus Or1]|uniref:Succinate-semialdehyde dehydrogenase n=1 Tax=Planococcus halocryophilus TaxID=1215089 RepID=A0A1C7DVB5_9BACL|nr:aldehyde dehydrogenase family protein [Planococcus halocryophilus]ANU15342.1 succinate-semialdehyde dehydrogenase [Planococcus halocryophilus]EMF47705.1 succinic semialdehyde dehydrogenase [Planococcus halocryophilus Or1]